MPTECISQSLQRQLADCLMRMAPLDEIRIVLASGAKINEPTNGLTPLHYAVWKGYDEAVQLLLTRGADLNAVDSCGYSPLHVSIEHGNAEIVNILLLSGSKVNFHTHKDDDDDFPRKSQPDEPLRLAIRNNHVDIARLLLEHGANPNKRYFFGTEINLVTDFNFLQLLLNFGADPNTRDRSGLTPLMKVVRLPHGLEAALVLLKYGADVTAMTDERHDFRTVLHYAVLSGNYKIIDLVIKQGAKMNYDEDFDLGKPSPLDLAILKGDPKIVKMLIGSGANVNFSSPIIGSPLHVVCADSVPNRYEILQMLLKAGANPNKEIYNQKHDHKSHLRPVLLEYLASNSKPSLPIVNLLLKYGSKLLPTTQFRDPNGVLHSVLNVIYTNRDSILLLLLQANESFDLCVLRRKSCTKVDQETSLFRMVRCPLSLKRQVRLNLWKLLGGNKVMDLVESFELPRCLERFLLFYES